VVGRMGGTGLDDAGNRQVKAFLFSLKAPENPLQNRSDLTETLARGQMAFNKAGCESCHMAGNSLYTDNGLHNVRTLSGHDRPEACDDSGSGEPPGTSRQLQNINPPSLLGLGRTAPYLHDGSVLTIRARLDQSRSPKGDGMDHGDTSMLSDQEIGDLETY